MDFAKELLRTELLYRQQKRDSIGKVQDIHALTERELVDYRTLTLQICSLRQTLNLIK